MLESQQGVSQIITNREEITELLQIASTFVWKFTFSVPDKPASAPFSTEIFHVSPEDGYLTVSSDINTLCPGDNAAIHFAVQNAGISLQFDTETLPYPGNPLAYRFASERRIAFPDKLIYKQHRAAIRVNFSDLDTIPITFFTEDGNHLNGTVEDLSATGVKARFSGYLVDQFEEEQLIIDCGLLLPNDTNLTCRVEVLGTSYEFKEDVSFFRCSFIELTSDDEVHIRGLIQDALKQKSLEKTA